MRRRRLGPLTRLFSRLVERLESLAHWDEPDPCELWSVADWGFDQPERLGHVDGPVRRIGGRSVVLCGRCGLVVRYADGTPYAASPAACERAGA